MNIFIDFDHTLYNTPELTKDMLHYLATYISESSNENYEEVFSSLKSKFKRGIIYDIYDLITHFSTIYNFDVNKAKFMVNKAIQNGKKHIFQDSIPFLKYLRKQGHKIFILSYNENEVYFQAIKIAESSLVKYVDAIIPTTISKGEMPLDFSSSIFIDDKPKDLISIYKKHPYGIFRIRRPNDTYSNVETGLPIIEVSTLTELEKEIEKILPRNTDAYTQ